MLRPLAATCPLSSIVAVAPYGLSKIKDVQPINNPYLCRNVHRMFNHRQTSTCEKACPTSTGTRVRLAIRPSRRLLVDIWSCPRKTENIRERSFKTHKYPAPHDPRAEHVELFISRSTAVTGHRQSRLPRLSTTAVYVFAAAYQIKSRKATIFEIGVSVTWPFYRTIKQTEKQISGVAISSAGIIYGPSDARPTRVPFFVRLRVFRIVVEQERHITHYSKKN